MKLIARFAIAAVVAVAPGLAGAYLAPNRQEVQPLSDGVFEVIGRTGTSAADYWCGAGDYARSKLRAPATQRVYIWAAIGPSQTRKGRKAVQFSLTPPANAPPAPGYSLSVRAVGDNMSAAAASQYCYDRITFER